MPDNRIPITGDRIMPRETEPVTIVQAEGAGDMDHVRALFVEYQEWLDEPICFEGFEDELRGLPGEYAPPRGRLLLARDGAAIAGGVGLWPLAGGDCEMRRLYVRPPWRGRGLGRRLAGTVVAEAGGAGYARVVLHTLEKMAEALALYRSMGFTAAPSYHAPARDQAVYLALGL